jgi:hypothetical protein
MSQRVSVDALFDPGSASETRKQVSHVRLADLAAVQRANQWRTGGNTKLPPNLHPAGDQGDSAGIQADSAQSVALAVLNGHRPGRQIHILGAQGKTSPILSPDRQASAIIALLRSPVGARFEHARIRLSTSALVSRSASRRLDLAATTKNDLLVTLLHGTVPLSPGRTCCAEP